LEKSGMSEKLRKSGIDIIGDVPWGTHFCQFCETKEDLMDTLIPYLKAGLENNELCCWVISRPFEEEEAKETLKRAIPDFDVYLKRQQIEIISHTHGHVNEVFLNSDEVINNLDKKLDEILASGYDGLRLAGNIFWPEQKDRGHLDCSEKKLDLKVVKREILSMCSYFLDLCSTADIIEIAFNHQFALSKREGKWELLENSVRKNMTESKRADEALCQSEQRGRLKLESILSPEGEIEKLELAELVDAQAIQSLMNDFYKLAHIPMSIDDLRDNVLVGVGWQDICTKFHRVNPETCKHCVESGARLSASIPPGEFKLYKCKNNMWHIATPIMVGGQQVGNIFSGQFLFVDEPLDYEFFRSLALKYGFNEEEYIAALEKVPRLSREVVDTGMLFFIKLANVISQLSFSNIRLAHSLAEREALVGALRESEKRYRMLFDHSTDAIILSDPRDGGKILSANPAACRLLGWAEEELIGKGCDAMFDLQDKAPSDLLDEFISSGSARALLTYSRRDGTTFPGELSTASFTDSNGEPRIVIIIRDVTVRKKAEEALIKAYGSLENKVKERTAELEETYKALLENERRLSEAQKMAHIGVWDWDLVTDEMYWSDEMYRIFGLNPQQIGSAYQEVLSRTHPDDRDYVDNAVIEALKGKPFDIDHRVMLSDWEEHTVHTQGEVVFDEKNSPVRMRGTVQDITESKKAEEKIKILADAVESSDDAIITESLDGSIISWNKGAEQIYGYSAQEILGKNSAVFEPENLKGEIKQLIEKIKKREKIRRYRTLRVRKDGARINVSVTLSPIFDASGELVAVSAIARDITERIKAEEALAKIEDARKKEIHHRIKNNLQVISSLLDLQAEKFSYKKIAPTAEILEAFRESQNRVISMSLIHEELYKGKGNDTLDFSAYLQKLAKNLFKTYSIKSKNIRLCTYLEENASFDMDTAVPLGIIVNELVSNSLKHAFRNRYGGEIRIQLRREEVNDEIHESLFSLAISDNGNGIPENMELGRTESLGLQLVSILVDQLDGKIEIKREQGTQFRITFNITERS